MGTISSLSQNDSSSRYANRVNNPANQRIDPEKVASLVKSMHPLTLPYFDAQGNQLQIWKVLPYGMVGSVVDREGRLRIISKEKIRHPLSQKESSSCLIERLESVSLRLWQIVFDPISLELTLWPDLKAAGKLGADGYKGHLTYRDLSAARREARGEVVKLRNREFQWRRRGTTEAATIRRRRRKTTEITTIKQRTRTSTI